MHIAQQYRSNQVMLGNTNILNNIHTFRKGEANILNDFKLCRNICWFTKLYQIFDEVPGEIIY